MPNRWWKRERTRPSSKLEYCWSHPYKSWPQLPGADPEFTLFARNLQTEVSEGATGRGPPFPTSILF
ncbi:hypothetical protein LIER_05907 [Lithospermum erythrorhizon]|uniref:Uncharacterized protein n=1 Tax=Lithospermum erythrorhizon TaxID=34254 RepID=A0AAV3P2V9_LITER